MQKLKLIISGIIIGLVLGLWFGVNIGREQPIFSNPFAGRDIPEKVKKSTGEAVEKAGEGIKQMGEGIKGKTEQ